MSAEYKDISMKAKEGAVDGCVWDEITLGLLPRGDATERVSHQVRQLVTAS